MADSEGESWPLIRAQLERALALGLPLRWIATKAGVSKSALHRFATGARLPRVPEAERIARVLGWQLKATPQDWAEDLERLIRQERLGK